MKTMKEEQKNYFETKGFKCLNTNVLLAKDFYKPVKEFSLEEKFALMGGLNNTSTY